MVAKTPLILKKVFYSLIWDIKKGDRQIFLTFDDGPHPDITPEILDILDKYNAKATFFSIGRNVERYEAVYKQIIERGHNAGNHTYSHLNGWTTGNNEYFEDINLAGRFIDSSLFRPPYGKIKRSQLKYLKSIYNIIMWDVMPCDFDHSISPERCLDITIKNVRQGSIVVFHDSEKSKERVLYALPRMLEHFSGEGFTFHSIGAKGTFNGKPF